MTGLLAFILAGAVFWALLIHFFGFIGLAIGIVLAALCIAGVCSEVIQ